MKPLVIIEEAELDVADAHAWHEEQRPGLGDTYLDELRAAIGRVHTEPHVHPHVERGMQRLLVRRFPYAILFRDEPECVVIIAVFHAKRDPSVWRKRR